MTCSGFDFSDEQIFKCNECNEEFTVDETELESYIDVRCIECGSFDVEVM